MPAEIVAVLVVSAEGDPGGLQAWNRDLGGGPPLAVLLDGGWAGYHAAAQQQAADQWDGEPWEMSTTLALPLWWDGALVPEGWDRAQRVAARHGLIAPRRDGRLMLDAHPSIHDVALLAHVMVGKCIASRVVRLARVDGRLVEP